MDKAITQLASQLAGSHYECEDCWYSCPKSEEGCCRDGHNNECTCGVEGRREAIIHALHNIRLATLEEVQAKMQELNAMNYDYESQLVRALEAWLDQQIAEGKG